MSDNKQDTFGFDMTAKNTGPVECLGQTFENDEARREHYLKLLAEKLKDPEFRKTPGFPQGTDEAILRLSDPPYYTACPNPFLDEYVRVHGRPYNPNERYEREPFAVDVSIGKANKLYKAHGYHTKIPHLAIIPSILHYTLPGDLVLDGFSGSGMTGVAAQWCESAPVEFRRKLEDEWSLSGREIPAWGRRKAIVGDLSPAATTISATNNLGFDVEAFSESATRMLREVESELGWMFKTQHADGQSAAINYVVWSEVFICPECSQEVVFVDAAMNPKTKKVANPFFCGSCGATLSKRTIERSFETILDPNTGKPHRRIQFKPVLVNYTIGRRRFEKKFDKYDSKVLDRVAAHSFPSEVPVDEFPIDKMYHGSRLEPKGFNRVHHMYFPRVSHVLAALWRKVESESDISLRNSLKYWLDSHFVNLSIQNRYRPEVSFPYNPLTGVYYIGSAVSEADPFKAYENKRKRIVAAFQTSRYMPNDVAITTGDCGRTGLPDDCVDYVFTDPPFGANIFYADLNFVVESWHAVLTNASKEAIVDLPKSKGVYEYQELMRQCFAEYHRVLKPGRWMTVVFSNSKNHIWRAIQEAMGTAGFVVADVRTLDKKQGSFRQVTSSAVKQDLVISAYKPTEVLSNQFNLEASSADSVWSFISEHLRNVPVFVGKSDQADVIAERTPQMLHDRMIAFFVQRGVAVPISGPEFLSGLHERYPERDGMYFLPGQVTEYDRKRTTVGELRQLSLFVSDEASAIQWIRQQIHDKPQSFQDLQPQFMQQLKSWAKHEKTIELKEILELNFFCYDGNGPVPSQIHSYLSTNFRAFRNLEKDDAGLNAKAVDRWYLPDHNKEGDLEKLRLRTLLKEFEDYKASTSRKIKQFRTEAVRAGFKHCYDEGDYQTIVDVAAKLPEKVIQEDEKLLMYYDVATMRLGD